MENPNSIRTLSFVRASDGEVNPWSEAALPDVPENHAALNDAGRIRADELIAYMRHHRAPMALGHVARAIAASGRWGPMETGFYSQIALHAIFG